MKEKKRFNAVNGIRRRTTIEEKKILKISFTSFNAVNGIRRRTTHIAEVKRAHQAACFNAVNGIRRRTTLIDLDKVDMTKAVSMP